MHTVGLSAFPNSLHRLSSVSCTQRTPAGLPFGISGIGDDMDIAMQQAPQPILHSIVINPNLIYGFITPNECLRESYSLATKSGVFMNISINLFTAYGVTRTVSLGNRHALRTLLSPRNFMVSLSNPAPNPPCGGMPYLCSIR